MKKFLSVVLVVIMMMSIATFAVSAKSAPASSSNCTVSVQKAPSSYLSYNIRLAIVQSLVTVTNARIDFLVQKAMHQQNPDLEKLVAQTTALAEGTIAIAASLGIEVVCEYVAYEINGQTVYIDPLIVIKRDTD